MSVRAAELIDLIVHEMRTPITVAVGSLRQLGTLPEPSQQAALERAVRSCARLERLAAELRDWGRLKEARPAPAAHRLPALLRDAAAAAALGRPDATLQIDQPPDVVVTGLPGLADSLRALADALLRAADTGEAVRGDARAVDGRVVITFCRPGQEQAPPEAPFDAELISGMGFSLPLAAATIDAGGGRIASRRDASGRLEAITVSLALAAPTR